MPNIKGSDALSVVGEFIEIDLSDDQKREKFYNSIGENVKTVPQIYIDDLRIGGYQDLVAWFNG